MSRQLNPNLFPKSEVQPKNESRYIEAPIIKNEPVRPMEPQKQTYSSEVAVPDTSLMYSGLNSNNEPSPFRSKAPLEHADAQVISAQLEGLKDKLKEVMQRQGQVEAYVSEVTKSGEFKFTRFIEAFRRVETFVKQNMGEMRENYANLAGKMNSYRVNESKIEQMIDRHGQMVQNFEIKINKLQKVIAEQELQLINYKSALDEARRVISKKS